MTLQNQIYSPRVSKPVKGKVKDIRTLSKVFGWLGLSFLVVALVIPLVGSLFTLNKVPTTGKVVEFAKVRSKSTTVPVVEYIIEGKTYRHSSSLASSPGSFFKVGDPVTVLYNPQNPQSSIIESYRIEWLLSFIFGAVGVSFGLVSVILLIINYWMRRKQLSNSNNIREIKL